MREVGWQFYLLGGYEDMWEDIRITIFDKRGGWVDCPYWGKVVFDTRGNVVFPNWGKVIFATRGKVVFRNRGKVVFDNRG